MSWWSDKAPENFDEMEGCDKCNFNKCASARTCKGCTSGDFWCYIDWDEEEDEDEE